MTISTEVRKAGPFIGNDSASVFPFAFKVFKAADLIVVRRQDNIGEETTLVLDSDYHVTLNSNQDTTPGGVVTLVAGALASGFTLVVSSELPYLQTTDLTNQGGFYPKVITNALDRLTIFSQQLLEITGRTLKLPITAPTNISAEIPLPNPSELIAWDETGTGLTTVSPQSLVTSIAYGSATADLFAGDGATTTFPLTTNPASVNNLDVSIGGHSQRPVQGGIGDYSWNGGASITFVTPPPAPTVPGDKNVLVRYMQAIPVSDSEALHAQTREALRRGYAEAGFNLVDGSFEEGGTLTSASDVLLLESTGDAYAWTGSYPSGGYDVAPGIDPTVAPGFVIKSPSALRGELLLGALRLRDGLFALRDIISITDYCVPGDGISDGTTDATAVFQQAIDELHAAGGGTLFIPPGTYTIRSVDVYSNIHIHGAGWATKLKHPVGYNGRSPTQDTTWPWEVDGMFTANFGGLAGTPNLADNIKDISLRDIWFHGTSVEDSFLETLNLLCLTAVSNVSITGCKFTGFRGDAINFPTGSILHGDNERHCSNLYIAHNYFDGLNYNNRQCISVYDCVGAVIEDNYMTRCTHATMPGAIDLEPGGAINPSMLNIVIRNNRFVDIGAAQDKPGIACLFSEITDQTKFGNIRIYDNYMSRCSGLQLLGINTATDILQYKIIDVSNNTFIGVTRGLVTRGLYGIEFTANKFEGTTSSMLIGSPGASGNLIFRGNTFQYCSSVDGYTALLYEVRGLKFIDNMVIDCGRSDGTLGDVFYSVGGSPVTGLEIINNTFWHNGPQMHQVLRNADGAVAANSLLIEDNKLIGDVAIGFPQKSHGAGVYAGAPSGTAVNILKLEVGTYYITTNVVGDAVNYGATATVVVGAVSTRITANNTSFVTLSVADGFITASQISGSNQDIHWQYSKQ